MRLGGHYVVLGVLLCILQLTIVFAKNVQAPTSRVLVRVYTPDGLKANVVQTLYLQPATDVACNTERPTNFGAFGIVDPAFVFWDDPANAGRVCLHDPPTRTRLFPSLPAGGYNLTVTFEENGVEGEPSDPVSFNASPTRPTNVRVGK